MTLLTIAIAMQRTKKRVPLTSGVSQPAEKMISTIAALRQTMTIVAKESRLA
jgi:hypothetical protein